MKIVIKCLVIVCSMMILSCPPPGSGTSGWNPPVLPPASAKAQMPCGINLSGIADWSEEIPFKDMFRIVRPWNNENTSGLTLDENGWIVSLGTNASAEALWDAPVNNPGGDFVCLYEGDGDVDVDSPYGFITVTARTPGRIEFTIDETLVRAGGRFFWNVMITRTNPADYVRNIRVMKREYESSYLDDPWNPDFISHIVTRFNTLRFMDWQATNNSSTVNWADRKTPDYYTQSAGNTGKSAAVAIEYMVDLCNRTGSNGWFCMPHLADDDYMQQFAAYLRDNLNSGLTIYIEYSNECWNWTFEQAGYCHVQGVAQNLDPDEWTAWRRFYAKRSIEMFTIFESVFAGQTDRLVKVLASQGAWYDMTGRVLNYVYPDGTGRSAAQHADALAIAPYFGSDAHAAPGSDSWNLTQLFNYLDAEVNGLGTPGAGDTVRRWMIDNYQAFINPGDALDQPNLNLRLIAYEGGQHLLPLREADGEHDQAKLELYRRAQSDPRMYTLYKQYLTHWREAGGEMFAMFSSVGNWGEWGYWGLLPNLADSPAASPKYAAVLEWMDENPVWW
ncbi:MAG: hypothetical protein JW904_00770 [Spirochaetales bacterium]|nr:hypothetical protein [Spirochaetales bacterium]